MSNGGSGGGEEPQRGNILRLIQIRFNDGRVRGVGLWDLSRTFLCLPVSLNSAWCVKLGNPPNPRFEFDKGSQLFLQPAQRNAFRHEARQQ